MSDSEIVESNNQFALLGKFIASDKPEADVQDREGVAMCWCANPLIFFNTFFLAERVTGPAQLKQRLHFAAEYLRSKPHPGLFFMCDDYLGDDVRPQLDAAIEEAGLAPALGTIGMVGDILSFERAAECPGLEIRRVEDEETLRSFADINSDAYALPPELMRGGLEGSSIWKEQAFCYVGYHDGKAVSTTAVIANDGHLYVAFVATRTDAQRHGFAAATMRHALEEAHQATGLHRTSLHSTDMGFSVYARMGYRRVTRIAGYVLKSAADNV